MPQDAYRSYTFRLLADTGVIGAFEQASGLAPETDVIAYREAGSNSAIRHLPGRTRYTPLTLRRGISQGRVLWTWFHATTTGTPDRRNVDLVMLDNDGEGEASRWMLFDAWISGWRAAALDATSDSTAIESLVLVYDRLERG